MTAPGATSPSTASTRPTSSPSRGHDLKGANYAGSNHAGAALLCTTCHKYHSSDKRYLIPSNAAASTFGPGGIGRVDTMPTWAGTFADWNVTGGTAGRIKFGEWYASTIDFTDYSVPQRKDPNLGIGEIGYTGEDDATPTNGFCYGCHRSAAFTIQTTNRMHTHMGDAATFGSSNTFFKDCIECHDPHGDSVANIYMVRTNIFRDNTDTANAVVFTAETGGNSYDEPDAENRDDICATCHSSTNVAHSYESATYPSINDHEQGANCVDCHPHGDRHRHGAVRLPAGIVRLLPRLPAGLQQHGPSGTAMGTVDRRLRNLRRVAPVEVARGVHVGAPPGGPLWKPGERERRRTGSGLTLGFVPGTQQRVGCNVCHTAERPGYASGAGAGQPGGDRLRHRQQRGDRLTARPTTTGPTGAATSRATAT